MSQNAQLNEIRGMLRNALNLVDALMKQVPAAEPPSDISRYRLRPGGPLSDDGIVELNRRFDAGESDPHIALQMGISVIGVARRRTMWRRTSAA